MAQLRPIEPELALRSAELILVGNGELRHLPAFRTAVPTGARILCDPDLHSFRAAGLRRGVWESFHPLALPRAFVSLFRGHGLPGLQGDPWQQGGALVLSPLAGSPTRPGAAPGRSVLFHHVSRHVSDLVSNRALLGALDQWEHSPRR